MTEYNVGDRVLVTEKNIHYDNPFGGITPLRYTIGQEYEIMNIMKLIPEDRNLCSECGAREICNHEKCTQIIIVETDGDEYSFSFPYYFFDTTPISSIKRLLSQARNVA